MKELEASETNDFVFDVAKKANRIMVDEVSNLKEDQRWLIYGRILNLLYISHFKMTINASNFIDKAKSINPTEQKESE